MEIRIFDTKQELGQAAAARAVAAIGEAVARSGEARVIAATGASQFEFLDVLTAAPRVEWGKVEMFHLDEYVGLPDSHPASFRRYLRERILERVHPRAFHFLAGDAADPAAECRRVGALLRRAPVDVAFVGIGENGHLAFIDPPLCDFADPVAVRLVELDAVCRQQQVRDGAFTALDGVPRTALSLTIPFLMRIPRLAAVVPGPAKRAAVQAALDGPVTAACPASILRRHPDATLYLDPASAAGVRGEAS